MTIIMQEIPISGHRVVLRQWVMEDLADLVNHADNPRVALYLMDRFPQPYTEDAGRAFILSSTGDTPVQVFAIEIDGAAAGSVAIHPQIDVRSRNAEIGFWLGETYWGRGIMTAVVMRIVDYAFATWNIRRVFASVYDGNDASRRVLEKAGFACEARLRDAIFKNGEYRDELIYTLSRDE